MQLMKIKLQRWPMKKLMKLLSCPEFRKKNLRKNAGDVNILSGTEPGTIHNAQNMLVKA